MTDLDLTQRQKYIRNFSIVAHIDHGKSTIADRILEMTDTVSERDMENQVLDDMDIERERGITIKLNAVELKYQAHDGHVYTFHLIDTPGHVDFSYEVSRSLAACEGALLVVDAAQGVQAQTMANAYLAVDNDLEIVPVINKIDLPSADVTNVKAEIADMIGIDADDAVLTSAKKGTGIAELLERIVSDVPAPTGDINKPLKALIFDSVYDSYRGVVLSVRIFEGQVKVGDKIELMSNGKQFEVTEVGVMSPKAVPRASLMVGDVGYITASIKNVQDTRVGDTITLADNPTKQALAGYRKITPMVYSGMYPVDNSKYEDLRDALEKLQLNDASLEYEPETSQALGFGFRVGFLGLLHMDVIQERLEREFNLDLIMTAPSVNYKIILTDGTIKVIDNPSQMPDPSEIKEIQEPVVRAEIMVPKDYVGAVMELSERKRGQFQTMDYLDNYHVNVIYKLPLAEIIYDFFDSLKSSTHGFASLDYNISGYEAAKMVKMDILLNKEPVDALSFIVHEDFAYDRGRTIVQKLKHIIPRQQFEVAIQAAIGTKVVARSTVKAYRKDVTGPLYGGDQTRKNKLLDKQKRGKKRMKEVGRVTVPQAAFMAVLQMGDDDLKK
ncbi:elongation factor 4 [Bombilactobacillus bombi]|uniref:translation elongation factor 4 n=1 Tax=Bombilactobacillus bombi TaxID=1303590 RepID=UPI000E58EDB6|nr:translation elongation factor 4 [Bombilactobacillus bombi]AXX64390.1 elongation factor 4 [Bombilactobacillus bombi]MCO6541601.1 translation elongation factor 4 [Lactobacillus sp.]